MGVEVKFKGVKPEDLMKRIEQAAGCEVLVGIPTDTAERKDDAKIDNAALAAIHERGNPARGLPARPFMVPGIERSSPVIGPIVEKAAKVAVEGGDVKPYLTAIGEKVVDSIKLVFTNNNWKPLSPKTIYARARRTVTDNADYLKAKSKRARRNIVAREIMRRAGDRPLIDTHDLVNSIKYVVREIDKE